MSTGNVRRSIIWTAGFFMLVAATVAALEVPYLGGRVNDLADMLDDSFEARLEERLRALEEETGAQVVVLTIPSLEGDPIEDFSMRVVETWKLGREGVDDGVLILVARDDRRMRIEVGYGLEGALTDAQSGRIIDYLMAPRFRQGDFSGGVDEAVSAVSAAVRGEGLELPESQPRETGLPGVGSLIFFLLFGLPFINAALSARGSAAWILYLFLTPFFFVLPSAMFGPKVGLIAAGVWLIGFPLLRLILPKAPTTRTGGRGGGVFWGPFPGAGGGGGFGGGGFGGFSGGGGSFGGGGASGGW
ncbi:MAG: TPM domain-containing protein [Acidobacteria bacterium]|jgi:uncharacterized protein|nr:TPM domain-containing protein [Acidobacteriota bacterium]